MNRLVVLALLVACKGDAPKPTMTPEQVISAVRDLADRGCECGTDKECFRDVRTEWEQTRREILSNAKLLKDADLDAYNAERKRFGACGDAAGLAVFDNV
ncbi:MAG TPA: hypothetical protein VMZ53_13560 [Kofleriaceae bacterium]|nr:hypothetical protein [Kofleriaceae bacterium]